MLYPAELRARLGRGLWVSLSELSTEVQWSRFRVGIQTLVETLNPPRP